MSGYSRVATQLLCAASEGDIATVKRLLATHGVSVSVNVMDKVSRILFKMCAIGLELFGAL